MKEQDALLKRQTLLIEQGPGDPLLPQTHDNSLPVGVNDEVGSYEETKEISS
jgi:hypothetical protein